MGERFDMLRIINAAGVWLILYLCVATPLWPQEKKDGGSSAEAVKPSGSVHGRMQAHPGGPLEEVDVDVYAAPVNLPTADAKAVHLQDEDLVLGVVVSGKAMAYPIRYLANYEVIDDRVGKIPVAPTW